MMTKHMYFRLFLALFAALMIPGPRALCQSGAIEPPTTAFSNDMPVATMKSLNEIEPRTLISQLPFEIKEPGSYYVSPPPHQPLLAPIGTNGITISSGGVRLDLNGFVLIDTNSTGWDAICINNGQCIDVVIRNGVIDGWGGFGINAGAPEITIADVKVVRNKKGGIYTGDNAHIVNCSAYGNGSGAVPPWDDGINAGPYSTISDCKARGNHGANIHGQWHCRITGCTATASGNANGIFVEDFCTVRDCDVSCNLKCGIRVGSACRVIENTCSQNGTNMAQPDAGILVQGTNSIVQGNLVCGNGQGIFTSGSGNLIINNAASKNGGPPQDYMYGPGMNFSNFMGTATTLNAAGGSGGPFSNSNPWANFSFTSP